MVLLDSPVRFLTAGSLKIKLDIFVFLRTSVQRIVLERGIPMDETLPASFVRLARHYTGSITDLKSAAAKAIQASATGNKLRSLDLGDLMCLVMFLDFFVVDSADAQSGTHEDELEQVAAVAREAGRFGAKLESDVF